jgi:hypothetical protein
MSVNGERVKSPQSTASETKRTEPSQIATLTPPVWLLLADAIRPLFSTLAPVVQEGLFGGKTVKN